MGGVIPAIKENFFQREIAEAPFRYQREVEAGQRMIVGVNRYEQDDEQRARTPAHRSRPRAEADRARAGAARAARLGRGGAGARAAKEASVRDDVNLMPLIVDASRAYTTMGEMCDALREPGRLERDPGFLRIS